MNSPIRVHISNPLPVLVPCKDLHLSDLGDLNIFIGASNTGKSSLLEAICAPLAFQADLGFAAIIQARSNLVRGLIASLFPNNNLGGTITISLGLPQSRIGDEDSTIDFTAKRAPFLINDYQTFLSQANFTNFGSYIILEISTKLTGENPRAYQAAFNETDGTMAPLWNLGPWFHRSR